MLDKMINECTESTQYKISDAISQIFNVAKKITTESGFNCLQLYKESKVLYDLAYCTVSLFNKKQRYFLAISK